MKKLEFFTTPEGRVMFVCEDCPARELKPESKEFIVEFMRWAEKHNLYQNLKD